MLVNGACASTLIIDTSGLAYVTGVAVKMHVRVKHAIAFVL